MSDISVITLVKGRAGHLARLLEGVGRSTLAPREVIIVDMSDEPASFAAPDGVPVVVVPLRSKSLPLAAARNRGAAAANGKHFLFLDVDCIPRSDLIARMNRYLTELDHVICAEVRYLGPEGMRCKNESEMFGSSLPHPLRFFPEKGIVRETNAGLFWSLLFGIRRETFIALDGFDEAFCGYGAEDTDFGFRAQRLGVPLSFLGGTGAFHQYHGVTDPPLQHFADIVANAQRFHVKWGVWPMDGWLAAFALRGLIAWDAKTLSVIRQPTDGEIAAAQQPPSVYL